MFINFENPILHTVGIDNYQSQVSLRTPLCVLKDFLCWYVTLISVKVLQMHMSNASQHNIAQYAMYYTIVHNLELRPLLYSVSFIFNIITLKRCLKKNVTVELKKNETLKKIHALTFHLLLKNKCRSKSLQNNFKRITGVSEQKHFLKRTEFFQLATQHSLFGGKRYKISMTQSNNIVRNILFGGSLLHRNLRDWLCSDDEQAGFALKGIHV